MLQTRNLLMLAAALTVTQVTAQDKPAAAAKPVAEQSLKERFENLGLIYQDKNAKGLQELWLLGRYHGHYHDTSGVGRSDSGLESRRTRLGFQARMYDHLTVHAQAISGSDFEPTYNGFTELWVRWEFNPALQLTVGQQKHRFTHDRNVSSRYMSFMERSMFTNMMGLDYTPAVTLSGRVGKLDYYAGVFSNQAGTDMWEAFTELHSGWSGLAAVTYDLGQLGGADTAAFYGSLLHTEARTGATNLTRFDDAASAALILTEGPAALVTEVTAGFGGTRGDAIGLNLQPSLFLTDKLELVTRYQLASASQTGGLRSQRRYESVAGLPNGEHYQATYLGLNYYLAGHRIKLLTGMEHARMNNRDAFTLFAGFRMFFGPQSNAPYPGNKLLKGIW
jgi:phosphate-selective porin OprO and OprP